jgi:hypothetical protein
MNAECLTYLHRIDRCVASLTDNIAEVRNHLGMLEQHYATISRRLDRIRADVDPIKQRLDLVEDADVHAAFRR